MTVNVLRPAPVAVAIDATGFVNGVREREEQAGVDGVFFLERFEFANLRVRAKECSGVLFFKNKFACEKVCEHVANVEHRWADASVVPVDEHHTTPWSEHGVS